jgi:hypothetical protein
MEWMKAIRVNISLLIGGIVEGMKDCLLKTLVISVHTPSITLLHYFFYKIA